MTGYWNLPNLFKTLKPLKKLIILNIRGYFKFRSTLIFPKKKPCLKAGLFYFRMDLRNYFPSISDFNFAKASKSPKVDFS